MVVLVRIDVSKHSNSTFAAQPYPQVCFFAISQVATKYNNWTNLYAQPVSLVLVKLTHRHIWQGSQPPWSLRQSIQRGHCQQLPARNCRKKESCTKRMVVLLHLIKLVPITSLKNITWNYPTFPYTTVRPSPKEKGRKNKYRNWKPPSPGQSHQNLFLKLFPCRFAFFANKRSWSQLHPTCSPAAACRVQYIVRVSSGVVPHPSGTAAGVPPWPAHSSSANSTKNKIFSTRQLKGKRSISNLNLCMYESGE